MAESLIGQKDTSQLEHLTWPEAREVAQKADSVVLIPVGATEQHGPHMPLGTDSINVNWICVQAARKANALVAPCIRFGVSDNHMDFHGTITLAPDTLIAVMCDVVSSLHHHGFRRFLFVNGHGGNNATLDVAAIKLRAMFPEALIGNTYSAALARTASEAVSDSGIIYHAEEMETSKSLFLTPELVDMTKSVPGREPEFMRYYHRYYEGTGDPDDVSRLVSYGLPPTSTLTKTGIMGDPETSTAEKGRIIAESAEQQLCLAIEDLQNHAGYTKLVVK